MVILAVVTTLMRSRNVMLTLFLLVSILLFAIYKKRQEVPVREAFHRQPERLYFYAFARCRMQCLDISNDDITRIMRSGVILMNKSNRALRPCPVFSVQARTLKDKYIRVVFEQCRNGTYVVNCYNLEQDTTCDCTTEYKPNPR